MPYSSASPEPRFATIDGLRGVAVMGILLMNITAFALPTGAYFNPDAMGPADLGDRLLWAVNFVLIDSKMRGLFALLFGASMMIAIDRAEANGIGSARTHFPRMGSLWVIGVAHAYLVWSGDILMMYAVAGSIAWFWRDRSPSALLFAAIALLVIQFVIEAGLFAGVAAFASDASMPGADARTVDSWRHLYSQIGGYDTEMVAAEAELFRSGYGDIVHYRLIENWSAPLDQLLTAGAETLGIMLLGMAAFKRGLLTDTGDRAALRRIAIRCYAIALPPMIGLAGLGWAGSFAVVPTYGLATVGSLPFRPVLVCAHAALLLLWLGSDRGAIMDRIADVGRMSLSNYLGTSIVMTTIFYGYGGALFAVFDRSELLVAVLLPWAAMLLCSRYWLSRCRYGPAEWIWRSLAQLSRQKRER